jgi:formiminotetrahydrofolate cyclodeaminase
MFLNKLIKGALSIVTDKATATAAANSIDTIVSGSIKTIVAVPTGVVVAIKTLDNAGGALATGDETVKVSDANTADIIAAGGIAGAWVNAQAIEMFKEEEAETDI